MGEFIDSCWFHAEQHYKDDGTYEADAAAYIWAAVDATIHQEAGFGLSQWIRERLESLPEGTFDDDTLNEIRYSARDIELGLVSGGRL